MADDFSPQIAALNAGVPIVLLPVRIEARYFNGGDELRVRVYPDQIHADAHEPELTATERDAGMAYWNAIFAAPDPKTRTTTPWINLASSIGPERAAWVVETLRPSNATTPIAPGAKPTFPAVALRTSEWGKAARAAALPKRWLVVGSNADLTVTDPSSAIVGNQKFIKWSNEISPTLDLTIAPDSAPPTDGSALPLQPTAKWLADFDEAERVGMGVRITAADCIRGQSPKDGVKTLFVVGVDWTQTPDTAAATLQKLMYSHVYTDGLSALTPGTPTNVTAASRAGAAPNDALLTAALDPETRPAAAAVTGHAADRLWRDLGIKPVGSELLNAIPNANGTDRDVTAHLINALWEGTLGLYASEFLPSLANDTTLAAIRDHARNYLTPAGAYPALRVGKQPYGVLPVVAGRGSVTGDSAIETWLLGWLGKLEAMWRTSANQHVPRLVGSSNVDADMNSLLQRVPVSNGYQYRAVLDRDLGRTTQFGLTPFSDAQAWTNSLLWQYLSPNVAAIPMMSFVFHPTSNKLTLPLVDAQQIVPGASLSTNYLQQIADNARANGTYDTFKANESGTSVLEAMVGNSVSREMHRADMLTINRYLLAQKTITALPTLGVLKVAQPAAGVAPAPVAAGTGAQLTNASQASRLVIPSITGAKTVRQFVTTGVARGTKVPTDYHTLDDMLKSVEFLAKQPADQLERCLRDVLDGFSFRLDAWITSMASRRLAASRAKTPTGAYIGGFGWIDDLKPAAAPTSLGYIHTPSLPHAATAAVLRSGHLAHNDAQHQSFDVNLRSDRVRTALRILEGVAQGQPLAAILGYQFERSVRDTNITLAQYILPFRRLVPLRGQAADSGTQMAAATPSDSIAARDVVDGVSLLQRWQNEGSKLLFALNPRPSTTEQTTLGGLLDALAATYDAVADTMVAEAVHQNVLGNGERAGAVLAALDRQEAPPRMDFVRTPRSGKHFTHRIMLLIGDDVLPAKWAALPNDARGKAEPRLNAWIAQLLGDPARYKFGATVTGSRTKSVTATLSELGLSPLSLAMASEAPGKDSLSELEERLMNVLAAKVAAPTTATSLALLDDEPAGSAATVIGLGALRALLKWTYTFVTTHRQANANDLSLPQDGNDEGYSPTELATRADAAATAFNTAVSTLDALIATPPVTPTPLRDALNAAAAFGVRGALPYPPPLDKTISDVGQLVAQAKPVVALMHTASSAQAALVSGFNATNAAPRDIAAYQTNRLRTLFGDHFPVLSQFIARNPADVKASIGDRAALLGGDDAAPLGWLQRMAHVRVASADLSRVLVGAEMLQSGTLPASTLVAQLPRTSGEKWLALPYGATAPNAELSIVMQTSGAVDFTKPLAGLFADAWPEVVPNRTETTGMTFHFDAPGARPPQSILIAVTPEPPNATWTVNALLETVMEARRLAPLRGVTPADLRWLGTMLPPVMMPAVTTVDNANSNPGWVPPWFTLQPALANVLGKV
ncbi:MAG TPA: hypothetical protein VGM82_00660 [Gemmatimonadaceae bacterium]|jgi:hypothetical protein